MRVCFSQYQETHMDKNCNFKVESDDGSAVLLGSEYWEILQTIDYVNGLTDKHFDIDKIQVTILPYLWVFYNEVIEKCKKMTFRGHEIVKYINHSRYYTQECLDEIEEQENRVDVDTSNFNNALFLGASNKELKEFNDKIFIVKTIK